MDPEFRRLYRVERGAFLNLKGVKLLAHSEIKDREDFYNWYPICSDNKLKNREAGLKAAFAARSGFLGNIQVEKSHKDGLPCDRCKHIHFLATCSKDVNRNETKHSFERYHGEANYSVFCLERPRQEQISIGFARKCEALLRKDTSENVDEFMKDWKTLECEINSFRF